ncbi:MAG: LysR family transcriptional regulator [Verrucomicrobiota bacterium]
MEWLNYHHLRYFWTVAKEGSLRRAAEKLRISQPSICAQVKSLEAAVGEALFRKQGRSLVMTETGHLVFGYAEEIFSLGQELSSAVKQSPTMRRQRLNVGISDSFPKLLTHEILKPLLESTPPVFLTCREGKNEDLLGQLATHRLDIVLMDEPAPAALKFKSFNHPLGSSGLSFCAHKRLAKSLKGAFPKCLDQAPALLPAQTSSVRRSLDQWFLSVRVQPAVIAEFEDAALTKVVATGGHGFIVLPAVVEQEAVDRYDFTVLGRTEKCREQFYAVTAERRMNHPAAVKLIAQAQQGLFKGQETV